MVLSNCHTHTTYCDGKNTAREMIESAIAKGFVSLGFSGHSPMWYTNDWGMTKESLKLYRAEIASLKQEYADKIDIVCGIELDCDYCDVDLTEYDYSIASVHQFIFGERVWSVDLSPDELQECVDTCFEGSWNKMARAYFDRVVEHVLSGTCEVVGHFDLITKFNKYGAMFDETDEEYRKIGVSALDIILDSRPDVIFEINAGAMYRKGNPTPYPNEYFMRHIAKRGGKITITSDSHCAEALDFAFDKVYEMCRACGFTESYIVTSEGFKAVSLADDLETAHRSE